MNKGRLESFSDNVFSIVMTLFVFDIKVPTLIAPFSDSDLWQAIGGLLPNIAIFVVTFLVLAQLWINHQYLYQSLAKSINRQLNLLNLAYLMFVIFIPFTGTLWGEYSRHQPAAVLYGVNIFCAVFISLLMSSYIRRTPGLANEHIAPRLINQGLFRARITLMSYALGILSTFLFPPLSTFFYLFPIIFNILPGSLNLAERVFRFSLD